MTVLNFDVAKDSPENYMKHLAGIRNLIHKRERLRFAVPPSAIIKRRCICPANWTGSAAFQIYLCLFEPTTITLPHFAIVVGKGTDVQGTDAQSYSQSAPLHALCMH